ncbi:MULTISPECIES: hypothetical protein [Pseudarthrobacter]|uniref:Uncharacterized membrane protein YbhN (UPF0104 family) n=1 Tax=Pseudarthrobacter niigatensis TaxID=369935 RepID=A0AAJ1SP24_9MICC|nr:hypothetical protein [Pseudarthrobacter niigatensis]MDQ0144431.1 uncharacterized membrane protein YbhN (UPF0104 family) [Pseudarthrobacter niigatensis]MDQ0265077.1 uncharacterized membrane protein YbhN (UPF0104 family) [Pseudarthrobacter niigatensis]
MSTELEIALVLGTALLWIALTLTILSAIDRPERKARRQERRNVRADKHRIEYRPAAAAAHSPGRNRHPRTRRLHPH